MRMKLNQHVENVVRRGKAFYGTKEPGHFLVNAHVPAQAPPIPPLSEFDLERQLAEWLDCRLEAARPGWAAKQGIDDDSIPSICPHFGIAEHAAWLGLEVRLQETTCLATPVLESPEDMRKLTLSDRTRWFQYMKRGYEHLRGREDGTFFLSVRGAVAPMDMANAVRGNDLFVDFLLQPTFAHCLMEFLVGAIHWYYSHLIAWADEIAGGHVFAMGNGWMADRCVGHLSNDAAMLCAPEVYEEFGFPYERRLAAKYDRVFYHVHNAKIHFLPRVAKLPGLAMLQVANDPATTPAIENLSRILAATGSANLMLHAESDQVRSCIDELKCRNVFLRVSCHDRSDAEDLIALVRDRSGPLE